MPRKLIKRVAIMHSGVYSYAREELPTLGENLGPIPDMFKDETHFNVYRPATVIAKGATLFTRLPITVEHPDRMVGPDNSDELMKGLSGDSARVAYRNGEAYVDSSLTLVSKDAIDYYDNGYKEVSPGYVSENRWVSEPTMYKGMPVHIILTNIKEANHLALVTAGRGGPTACVLDSKGDSMFKSKIFRNIHDLFTRDSAETITSILAPLGEKTLTADKAGAIVDKVSGWVKAFPESEGKAELSTVLEDLRFAADINKEEVRLAIDSVSTLFDQLNTAVTADTKEKDMSAEKKPEAEPVKDAAPEETKDYAPGATGTAGAGAQKMVADEGGFLSELKALIAKYEGTTDAKPLEGKETPAEEKAEEKAKTEDATPVEEKKTEDAKPTTDSKPVETVSQTSATIETTDSASKGIDDFMKDLRA